MFRFLTYFLVCTCLCLACVPMDACAEDDPDDLVDVFESGGKIIAAIEARGMVSADLQLKESVLWHGAKGYIGAYLTNRRFMVISAGSGAWQALALAKDESQGAVATLSPYLTLLVTRARAVVFDGRLNRFVETRLPLREETVTARVKSRIAVIVTSDRAYGFASEGTAFDRINFGIREHLAELKIRSGKAVIRTSDRLLSFEASGAGWQEYRLN